MVWAKTQYVGCASLKYLRVGSDYDLVVGCMFWPNVNIPSSPIYIVGDPATNCDSIPNSNNKSISSNFKGLCVPYIPANEKHPNSVDTVYSYESADPYLSKSARKAIIGKDITI